MQDLDALSPSDEPVFGGKACGLGRLLSYGARVPPGFALPATLDPPPRWPASDREALLSRAAPLIAAGPLAVRSSAPGEDGTARSFAGLFETVLGVRDEAALLAAVERCITSGAGERVRAYTGDAAARPVGVVVQAQVAARAAGVCFTVDPSGRDGAVIVEAVAGTGDALVSGRVRPDAWRVYPSGLGTWDALREPSAQPPVLDAESSAAIAREARALARSFGSPLDLEWAIDHGGTLFWLQARPVTAAAPLRSIDVNRYFTLVDDGPITVWANWNVREVMPDPFTPLNWSLWREVILPVVLEDVMGVKTTSPLFPQVAGVDLVHGRIYWNMNALMAGPMGPLFVGRILAHLDTRAAEVIRALREAGVLQPRRMGVSRWRVMAPALAAAVKSVVRFASVLRPGHALRSLDACGRSIAARPPVPSMTDEELVRELGLLAAPEAAGFRRSMQLMTAAFVTYAAADHAFRGHPRARRLLAAGIRGNPTTAISLGIDALVETARPLARLFEETASDDALFARLEQSGEGRGWLDGLRGFLEANGQRCPNEFDIATPRWADEPRMIVDLVRAGLRAPAGENATARLEKMARERKAAIEEAAAASPFWWRPALRALARVAALYMPLREAPKHSTMFVFRRMRQAALELGARLAARGWIDVGEDVMFLEKGEIVQALLGSPSAIRPDLRALVVQRRARHERHLREKPPHFVRSDGVPVREAPDEEPAADGSLHGVGASWGAAEGPVRILHAPDPRAMSDGDVIVMEFADPGWTPLFPRAAGVVMEVGGAMCHAAVVARELGIPAVFGVADARRLLKEGQRVRVDGEAGTVRPVEQVDFRP